MSWLSYFIPQDIFRTNSPCNHNIRVQTFMGRRHLMVDGSQQSGPYIEKLWRACLAEFDIDRRINPGNILVLGVGGGTVMYLLNELFPKAPITAVDIDPVMIEIGRKYFGLRSIKNLTIKTADAQAFIQNVRPPKKYGLVVIDLFSGAHIPEFVETGAFMEDIKYLMAPGARSVVNYLREKEYGRKSHEFADLLRGLFTMREFSIFRNHFFLLE